MGRFKIYDANKFVKVLSDINYAQCLMCDKKLKNIMGNIKRHYEQMHSICVNATNPNKRKKSKRKMRKYDDNDKDYKVNIMCKNSNKEQRLNNVEINDKIVKKIRPTSKEPEIIGKLITRKADIKNINNKINTIDSQENPKPDAKEKEVITKVAENVNSNNNNNINIDSPEKTTSDDAKDHKIKNEKEVSKLNLPNNPIIEQLPSTEISFKKIKLSPQNNELLTFNPKSLVHNIQINSFDSPHESVGCFIATKTQINIPLKNLQQGYTFQKCLQTAGYHDITLNVNYQTVGQHMDILLSKMKENIIEIVNNRLIYLKLDVVSSRENNIMLVNIQFIKDFEVKIITLSVLEILDEHLASYLKGKVLQTLERYKIDISHVFSITKDNANNAKESLNKEKPEMENLLNNHLSYNEYCQNLSEQFPGHIIHFVACDIIKQLNENISQSRDSVRNLHRKMSQLKMKDIPVLDNTNSWYSLYYMIKSLLDVRDKVENNNLLLVEIDWTFALKFEQSFRPIVSTALILQSNNNFIMGDFYREWLLCEMELEELSESNELALYLLQALNKRKLDLFKNPQFLAALYLDPRFCYMGSMHFSDKQKDMAMTQLLEIFTKLKTQNNSTSTSNHHPNQHNDRYIKLEKKEAQNLATTYKNKIETSNINEDTHLNDIDVEWLKESLEHLQFGERLPYNTNILYYWKTAKYKNPILAKIAEIALAAPATQATINRALSAWPILMMKYKHNINLDNIENLLLLKLNQDLVDKIVLE